MKVKNKSNKFLSVLTLLITVAVLFGACSENENNKVSKIQNTTAIENTTAVPVVAEPATEVQSEPKTELPKPTKAETVPVTEQPQTTEPVIDMSDFEITNNSISKLNLISCESYVESVYPNNAYHPKVIDTGRGGWNGYRYWVSYTPYPAGDDRYENPHIVATNDLINYSEIKYAVPEPANHKRGSIFNSDSHIVFNGDLNRLELFWRYTNYDENYSSIKFVYSYDGNTWSETETFFETYDRKKEDMVSPAIIYENGTYKVWYVNGYKVRYREYNNGWSDEHIADLPYADGALSWHIDVIKNSSTGLYEILTCATTDKRDRKHMNLYYSASADGLNWDTAVAVVTPSSDPYAWDGGGLYRSTLIYTDGLYYVLYSGRNDSGNIGVSLLFGSDMYNLYGTNCDYIHDGTNSALKLEQYIKDNFGINS